MVKAYWSVKLHIALATAYSQIDGLRQVEEAEEAGGTGGAEEDLTVKISLTQQ